MSKFLVFLFGYLVFPLWYGFVIFRLWSWFAFPLTGVALGWLPAVGLSELFSIFSLTTLLVPKELLGGAEVLLMKISCAALSLLYGYIIHCVMVAA